MKSSAKNDPAQLVLPTFLPVVIATGNGTFKVEMGKPVYWLSPKQLAAEFSLDRDSIYRWIDEGTIPEKYLQRGGKRKWQISSEALPFLRQLFSRKRGG